MNPLYLLRLSRLEPLTAELQLKSTSSKQLFEFIHGSCAFEPIAG